MSETPEVEELEVGMGSIYTRIDCPYCYECFELEGDREGETIECEFCHEKKKKKNACEAHVTPTPIEGEYDDGEMK